MVRKVCFCLALLIVATAFSAVATITIKQVQSPTSTYILDCQTRQISPEDILGYDIYSSVSVVTEQDKYTVRIVPISEVGERMTVAFTTDNKTMQYGIVASITENDTGTVTLLIPDSSDSYLSITSKEFRGIVLKK